MSNIEFFVKLRDAAQMMADAANEYLEKQAPASVRAKAEDFDKLFWEDREGAKGPYQQTSKKTTNNHEIFQALQSILKSHNGFCKIGAYNYWSHQGNVDVVDRRKK